MSGSFFYSILGFQLAVIGFSLAIIILRFRRSRLHFLWMIYNVIVACWGLCAFFIGRASNVESSLFCWRVSYPFVTFIAVIFFHVIHEYCELKKKYFLIFVYAQGFVISTFSIFTNFFITDPYIIYNDLYYVRLTLGGLIALAIWIGAVLYGHYHLLKTTLCSTGAKRFQTFYFLLGMMTGFIFGVTNFFPALGLKIYPFGNIGISIYCIIVTYAIIKYRLMDIRVFISRAAAFFITYPLLLGIPFFFGYRFYPYLYTSMGRHWWLVPSGMLAIIASAAPLVYSKIRRKMEGKLLAEQKQYQKLLLQAASGMVTQHDLGKLAKLIAYILRRAVKIDFAAIFLDNERDGVYRLSAHRDHGKSPYKNVTFLYEHPFVDYLRNKKEPVFFDELPDDLKKSLAALSRVNLIIPSNIDDNLLGFVFLGEKENKQPFTEDDINVFRILANQAALAIENCLFIKEFKQAQEKIFTAEKLASIGGMADGVAHQIKNRLNQFSVASGELKYEIKDYMEKHPQVINGDAELKKTLDYLSEIGDSLLNNVKRTDGIIKGILNFARVEEKETFFGYFSFKEVVDLSLELLKVKHEVNQIPLTVDLGPNDLIYGVKSQITEAVYNVLDNSYEAVQEKVQALGPQERDKFIPAMAVKLSEKDSSHLIEVSDNGPGIAQNDQHKIFAPFFTTKSSYKSGTGIGMYVVRRMIEENHHGKVWFVSNPGAGVTFYIELPKK
jgi:signal transduction histidine kinase